MTVITKKQLNRVTELLRKMEADNDMSKYSRAEREMFITLISMLGLRVTKVDGFSPVVVPDIKGESLWRHCKNTILREMSNSESLISMHDEELDEMERGIKAKNESRKNVLINANKNCELVIDNYKNLIREIEED